MKKILIVTILFLIVILSLSGCVDNNEETAGEDEQNIIENNNGEDGKTEGNDNKKDGNHYSWSTMDQGPYRDQISYATSTDLLNWVDSQIVLAEHASVPGAVYKDEVIYVYFTDVSVDGIAERLGLITSEDNGETWTDKVFVTIEGINDKIPVDPAPFLLDDGRIRLYYFDINEIRQPGFDGANKIYSIVSSDGVNFTQEDGVRFQRKSIYDPAVIKVDALWRLYVGDMADNRVISAVSDDGLTFTEEGIAFEGGIVPDVFFKNDTYYLYTVGIDISTSYNGSSFAKTPYRFESQINRLTADPSVIELNDGTYMMLYKTKI
jgi:uncharacterized protein YxeA